MYIKRVKRMRNNKRKTRKLATVIKTNISKYLTHNKTTTTKRNEKEKKNKKQDVIYNGQASTINGTHPKYNERPTQIN